MSEPSVLHAGSSLQIDHIPTTRGPTGKLAIIFSSLGNRMLGSESAAFLLADGFDVVRFSSIANDWFQTVPEAAFDTIERVAQAADYRCRVALGSSMGAYGAIAFSARLRLDRVLAFAPQFQVAGWRDGRFAPVADKLEWKYLIGPQSVRRGCRYCMVYDPLDFDAVHVAALRALIGEDFVDEIALPYTGHTPIYYLAETGHLRSVTLDVLNGRRPSPRALRGDRRKSRLYCTKLANALAERRPALAARVRALAGPDYAPPPALKWAIDRDVWPLSALATRYEAHRLRRMRFDEDFYRRINWDVEVAGVAPIDHYVRAGRREGRLVRFRDSD